ncbi:hypothetical protein LEP1GSC188_4589 [Leptospira weilii serovar Topaz str. LT2116]|uniref:Uncharacterized protein n=1 Tax=Leptospira weilii serovar Topaz str. LT2116 TaxID=1088540 RepID=M3H379_9LEPT|nr:hypothetical protein LEP1GSC188_4589 [Leptospira weilii serovar Topaz str. LT2116]
MNFLRRTHFILELPIADRKILKYILFEHKRYQLISLNFESIPKS